MYKFNLAAPTSPSSTGTVYTSPDGAPYTKTFYLDSEGLLASRPAPRIWGGTFRALTDNSVRQLKATIEALQPTQALGWGVEKSGLTEGRIVKKGEPTPSGTVPRSLSHFGWPTGHGFLMLDLDHVPEDITQLDPLRALLVVALPELAKLPMLGMSSASAMLRRKDNNDLLRGLTGARFYVPVERGSEIPALGRTIHERLLLAGHGRPHITDDGRVLLKSLIDAGVWSPERVDYAAGAHLKGGLVQRRLGPMLWNEDANERLDTTKLPPLTAKQTASLKQIEHGLRLEAAEEAAARRAAWSAKRVEAGVLGDVTWNGACDVAQLSGDFPITLASGAPITVREILADPATYHGLECKDPAEPDYRGGADVGIIYSGQPQPLISSRAHGGLKYYLAEAAEDVFQADLTAAPPAATAVPSIIVRLNKDYVVVPDGIYCTRDHVVRSPDRVRLFLASEPGIFAQWLSHPQRARASRIVFDPDLPPLALSGDDLNVYPGLALTPEPDSGCPRLLDHIGTIICSNDPELYRWVMSWLAHIVQKPKGKCGTALVLKAPPGSGKSFLGAVMRRIVGTRLSVSIADRERLLGRFNGHLEPMLFVEAAEAVWAKDASAFGVLKDLITADVMCYENKGQRAHSGPNYARILFTSNERHAVPVSLDDRRFSVLTVADRYAEGQPGRSAYWSALWEELNRGGAAAFLHVLLTYPCDEELIRHPLQTEARREEQAENLDSLMSWLVEFADSPPSPLERIDDLGPGEFRTGDLYALYLVHCRSTSATRYPASKIGFSRWLSSLKQRGLTITNGRADRRADRSRTKQFPPLPDLRTWLQQQAAVGDWDMSEQWPGTPSPAELLATA